MREERPTRRMAAKSHWRVMDEDFLEDHDGYYSDDYDRFDWFFSTRDLLNIILNLNKQN